METATRSGLALKRPTSVPGRQRSCTGVHSPTSHRPPPARPGNSDPDRSDTTRTSTVFAMGSLLAMRSPCHLRGCSAKGARRPARPAAGLARPAASGRPRRPKGGQRHCGPQARCRQTDRGRGPRRAPWHQRRETTPPRSSSTHEVRNQPAAATYRAPWSPGGSPPGGGPPPSAHRSEPSLLAYRSVLVFRSVLAFRSVLGGGTARRLRSAAGHPTSTRRCRPHSGSHAASCGVRSGGLPLGPSLPLGRSPGATPLPHPARPSHPRAAD